MDAPLRSGSQGPAQECIVPIAEIISFLLCPSVFVRKGFFTQMKNISKRFSQSVRKYFHDGITLYAIATAGYPEILNYLKMSQEIRGEE